MTDKRVGRPMGRMKEADAALSAAKRLENEGRADRARDARAPWTRSPTPSAAARQPSGSGTNVRANSAGLWEVTMLTILLIIIAVLLLTGGGFGYRRRGRRGF
jgi:hypothetical protein